MSVRRKPNAPPEEADKPVWASFRYCKDKCLEPSCKQCGWFWGPGHPNAGQPARFGVT